MLELDDAEDDIEEEDEEDEDEEDDDELEDFFEDGQTWLSVEKAFVRLKLRI